MNIKVLSVIAVLLILVLASFGVLKEDHRERFGNQIEGKVLEEITQEALDKFGLIPPEKEWDFGARDDLGVLYAWGAFRKARNSKTQKRVFVIVKDEYDLGDFLKLGPEKIVLKDGVHYLLYRYNTPVLDYLQTRPTGSENNELTEI